MQVHGYDSDRGAWRVTVQDGAAQLDGFVPETLVAADPARPPHEDVYRWLDRHRDEIEKALIARRRGTRPAAPYDCLSLGED